MKCLAILAFLAMPLNLVAQEVKFPEPQKLKTAVGQPLTIELTTDGEVVRWYVVDNGLFMIDPSLLVSSKATQVWANAPGSYRLLVYTCKDNKLSEPAVGLVVVGDSPTPGPGPKPPVPPDNLTGIPKKVRDWAAEVQNTNEAHQLGSNFESIASAIAAGAYNSLDFRDAVSKIIKDTYEQNKEITTNNTNWAPFFLHIREMLNEMNPQLTDLSKIKDLYTEIAIGLKAVK